MSGGGGRRGGEKSVGIHVPTLLFAEGVTLLVDHKFTNENKQNVEEKR